MDNTTKRNDDEGAVTRPTPSTEGTRPDAVLSQTQVQASTAAPEAPSAKLAQGSGLHHAKDQVAPRPLRSSATTHEVPDLVQAQRAAAAAAVPDEAFDNGMSLEQGTPSPSRWYGAYYGGPYTDVSAYANPSPQRAGMDCLGGLPVETLDSMPYEFQANLLDRLEKNAEAEDRELREEEESLKKSLLQANADTAKEIAAVHGRTVEILKETTEARRVNQKQRRRMHQRSQLLLSSGTRQQARAAHSPFIVRNQRIDPIPIGLTQASAAHCSATKERRSLKDYHGPNAGNEEEELAIKRYYEELMQRHLHDMEEARLQTIKSLEQVSFRRGVPWTRTAGSSVWTRSGKNHWVGVEGARTASQSEARSPAVYQRNTPSARQRETLATTTRSMAPPGPSDESFYGLDQHELQLLNQTEIADFEENVVRLQQAEDAERDRIRSESNETAFRMHQASFGLHEGDERLEQELQKQTERRTGLRLKLRHMKAAARTSQEEATAAGVAPARTGVNCGHNGGDSEAELEKSAGVSNPNVNSEASLEDYLDPNADVEEKKLPTYQYLMDLLQSDFHDLEEAHVQTLKSVEQVSIGRMQRTPLRSSLGERQQGTCRVKHSPLAHWVGVEGAVMLSDSEDEDTGGDMEAGVATTGLVLVDKEDEDASGLIIRFAEDSDMETSMDRFDGAAGNMEGGPTKATAESVEGVPEKPPGKCGKNGCHGTNLQGQPCGAPTKKIEGANPWYCHSHQP